MKFAADKMSRCEVTKDANPDNSLVDEVIAFARQLGGE
jgi:hypothetical protein